MPKVFKHKVQIPDLPPRRRLPAIAVKTALWLCGIVAAVFATYLSALVTGLFKPLSDPLSKGIARFGCELSNPIPTPNDKDFLAVFPTLDGDPDGKETKLLMTAFLGTGINVARVCDSMEFDFSKGTDVAEARFKQDAVSLIKRYKADIVISGMVVKAGDSMQLWMTNEVGGCDIHPRQLVLDRGLPPVRTSLTEELQQRVLSSTLAELAAACKHDAKADWSGVAGRVKKTMSFLQNKGSALPSTLRDEIGDRASDALGQLAKFDRSDDWYSMAKSFNLGRASGVHAKDSAKRSMDFFVQAALNSYLWRQTSKAMYLESAFELYDQAIAISPDRKYLISMAGLAEDAGDFRRAVSAFTVLIEGEPKEWFWLQKRAMSKYALGNYAGALADFEAVNEILPNDWIFVWAAVSRLRDGNSKAARKSISAGLKAVPESPIYSSRDVLQFLAGNIQAPELVERAKTSGKNSSDNLCAATIIIGQKALVDGRPNEATEQFNVALDLCGNFGNYIVLASAELRRLRR